MTTKNEKKLENRKEYINKNNLDIKEQEIVKDIEAWSFTSANNLEERKKRFNDWKKATLKARKTKITIAFNNEDLEKVKEKAIQEGLPYQTLIGSILHKALQN